MNMMCKNSVLYIRDVLPSASYCAIRISACRGRNPLEPTRRSRAGERFSQFIEIGSGMVTNTITSVDKDNWLWIERDL